MKRTIVLLLSGPNLNLLGEREPRDLRHGRRSTTTSRPAAPRPRSTASTLEHVQSNHEGELVDAIHGARGRCAAIVINPAAFTHYAWSIHDALATFEGPMVELHLSNPNAREAWRHTSVVAPVANGSIVGLQGRAATGWRRRRSAELLGVTNRDRAARRWTSPARAGARSRAVAATPAATRCSSPSS